MWKVGGLIIETAAGRWIILPKLKLVKMSIFLNGPHPKIFNVEIFRICVLKGSATHFRPCYSCPKSGEGGKTRFASIIKVVLKKKIRLPKKISCQVQLREVFIGVYNCVHVWTCICSCVQSIVFERLTHGSWRPMNLKKTNCFRD